MATTLFGVNNLIPIVVGVFVVTNYDTLVSPIHRLFMHQEMFPSHHYGLEVETPTETLPFLRPLPPAKHAPTMLRSHTNLHATQQVQGASSRFDLYDRSNIFVYAMMAPN
ncbi:hypothetical protein HDU98_012303 [Podochytrium sp. JEL0797]|nr:hypothetical protein HDU98_012303 [Podochytrium sp. JEL0797]